MSYLYSIPEVREHAKRIVRNEVHYCVSHLISQIMQAPDTWRELGIDEDDAYMLAEIEDFESAALEHIEDADADDLRDFLTDRDVDFEEGTEDDDGDMVGGAPIAELRELARKEVREQSGADREYCDHARIDPERSEVFEHWIVSDWLASKLEAAGHPVARDFLGLTIWGRPTTGQAISLDAVILEIANDCLKG